jgi:formylglycine-generating enzyme required for sulfatase activity/tRNA A-37 threonylcarbamoyl transferase component Bud32
MSPAAAEPTAAFLTAVKASGLLSPAQLEEMAAWVARSRADVTSVAREINERGWLTAYQIKEIFKGRGKGLVVGQFVLLDLLGEGGMGRVYRARQTRLGRDVALKIIRKERLTQPAAKSRFMNEILAISRMAHPNVVIAFDAGPIGDTHFVAMELVDGLDLTRLVRERGPLPVPESCYYVQQAALGLHHAFEQGMVHRDIKPSNILIGRDGKIVKLVDLGLARLQESVTAGANRVTQEGYVIGTPDFLSPEQARNPGAVDIRADIYALGATLFYILTGRVPYEGANATEKLMKHCTEPPPAIRSLKPEVPVPIDQIIQWCMAKQPDHRPQTPMQLAMSLQPFAVRPGTVPAPAPTAIPPQPAAVPYPAPYPAPPPAAYPAAASAPSASLFPETVGDVFTLTGGPELEDDPIRRRAARRFPYGLLFVGFAGVVIMGILAFAAYRYMVGSHEGPVEALTNSVGMKMVKIEGGTFRMGSPMDEIGRPEPRPGFPDDESPVHDVSIRGPFLMSATEVTHSQYVKVLGSSPGQSVVVKRAARAAEHPVDMVSFEEAAEFCRALTEKERTEKHARSGWAYRLPTEAEWEYACRAGTTTPFAYGATLINQKQALYTPTGDEKEAPLEAGSVRGNINEGIPGKVATYEPNRWGLFDMHGNVAEWCLDWHKAGYPGEGALDNPLGPQTGDRKVIRSGSFRDPASKCRSAARDWARPSERRVTRGFRVVYAPEIK